MRVAVLGSGVVGVTTAWYAARAGHEVTVLDRQPGPALETSFANAGEVSPGYAAPWAAPGIPLKAIKWLFMKHRPLVIWPQFDPAQWQFVLMMLRNCTTDRYARNKSRMLPLAAYSRDCLQDLRKQTGIRYDERAQGTLQLFRTTKQLDGAARDMALLERFGVAHELLDVPGCLLAEPGLRHVSHRIAGGLRLPGDETGDCQMFTAALAERAAAAGVEFRNEVTIRALLTDGDRIRKVHTDQGDVEAEAYVMALGSYSPLVLRPIGIRIPLYPVKGYSITTPIHDPDSAPESTIMDETFKVAITRLGDRIRAAGSAELKGYDLQLRSARREAILNSVRTLFPRASKLQDVTFWTGLRPMMPDGPPLIGATRYTNLWLNTGHGTLGWTMACGSAAVLADLLSSREPAVSLEGLNIERYGYVPI